MRGLQAALLVLWLALSLAWIRADHLVRDGDEEGHVGAAELFLQQLDEGRIGAFATDALWGDLGEYPPLYPAVVGGWWFLMGGGQPGGWPVRAINLLWPMITAFSLSSLARRLHGARRDPGAGSPGAEGWAATGAFAAALLLPLENGLGRHFMPEGMLVAAVALAVAVAAWAAERPGPGRALALGLVLGLGLLVKQTFLPLALVPVLVAGWRLGRWGLLSALSAGLVFAPWLLGHLGDQLAYGSRSVGGGGTLLAQALYYPWALLFVVVGPPLSALALLAAGLLARDKGGVHRRAMILGLAWLLGGLVLITAIPKKYPRLAAPLSPAIALLVGAALARKPRLEWLLAGTLLPAGWLLGLSLADPPLPDAPGGGVDGRCPQRWLRPPHAGDLGLAAAARRLQDAPPGPILVLGMPDIPCSVQTTHPWPHHLGPYLRRSGAERELRTAPPAALVLRWVAEPMPEGSDGVPIPELGGWLRLEGP